MTRYAVLATMRNEGPFVLEWVAHHKALGFDDIVICTSDCTDGTDHIVRRLQTLGLVRHHVTRGRMPTVCKAAYREARALPEIAGADWLWVCDADEFLVVKTGDGSVRALTAAASAMAEVISVPTRFFGSSGIVSFYDRPVTAQFTRAEAGVERHPGRVVFAKSMLREPVTAGRIGIHIAYPPEGGAPFRRELPGGREISFERPLVTEAEYAVAQVNHYALRSMEAFLVKRARGRAKPTAGDMGEDYWREANADEVEDLSVRRYDAAVAEWRTLMASDRRLRVLHNEAVSWYRRRAADLRAEGFGARFIAEHRGQGRGAQGQPSQGRVAS